VLDAVAHGVFGGGGEWGCPGGVVEGFEVLDQSVLGGVDPAERAVEGVLLAGVVPGLLGGVGGDLRGEQFGAVGAEQAAVEEVTEDGEYAVLADDHAVGVVGGGLGVGRVGGVVGADVLNVLGAGSTAGNAPLAVPAADASAQSVGAAGGGVGVQAGLVATG